MIDPPLALLEYCRAQRHSQPCLVAYHPKWMAVFRALFTRFLGYVDISENPNAIGGFFSVFHAIRVDLTIRDKINGLHPWASQRLWQPQHWHKSAV